MDTQRICFYVVGYIAGLVMILITGLFPAVYQNMQSVLLNVFYCPQLKYLFFLFTLNVKTLYFSFYLLCHSSHVAGLKVVF